MTTNYKSIADKIRQAKSQEEIKKLSKLADDLYNLGLLTENQLSKLDSVEMDALIKIETP